ncbi:hypothetical protein NQK81_13350 [Amycolatopsis roodepoortensis]|uniref:hypothetical protein n=1 Tax=Amycolatopsis roodepoortensis TaxID=700274 RepID=UPI00214A9ADF|nr:hypothetical protein [Amycolatopsis roodepoortensis]UUV34391.1 hypothetical protein NQK81_13350 [Amycolatopsis roodepoortensis]
MADTSTERARRSRAHARDDHSLCRAQRCGVARAHVSGDHSRCDASWCDDAISPADWERAAEGAASRGAGPAAPLDPVDDDAYRVRSSALEALDDHEFGPAGRELWEAVNPDGDMAPLQTALLREACRTADRLRALDRALRGDGPWLDLSTMDGRTFVVVVTEALKESRQQAMALKALVAELRQSTGSGRNGHRPPAPDGPGKGEGASIVDLSAAITARLAAQAEG